MSIIDGYELDELRDKAAKLPALEAEIERLRAILLNIQAEAEKGRPVDAQKLATRCRFALAYEQPSRTVGQTADTSTDKR